MRIISSGLLMVSAAGITFGLVHLRFWFAQRERKDQLAFSLVCISFGAFAWFELGLMHSATPEAYGQFLKWAQPVSGVAIVAAAWFIKENLGGRASLFWAICGFRGAAVLINLFSSPNINFTEIATLGRAEVLDEVLSYPIGTSNPLVVIPQAGLVLLIVYAIDANIGLWRKGYRRKALVFGSSSLLFAAWIVVGGFGVQWGILDLPLVVSPALLILAAPMLYELNYDMQRSAQLSRELSQRERELQEALDQTNLSVAASHLGMWSQEAGEKEIFMSGKGREIFEFSPTGLLSFDDLISRVHPDDRERVVKTIRTVEENGGEYHTEYRLRFSDGREKWVDSRGRITAGNGSPSVLHGASLDITDRKIAERAVHELSGKLVDAQEKERARLARELHDDLSQRLALLSIRLETLKSKPFENAEVESEIEHLIKDIQDLSADMHRISHELHPAKLSQLGLEATLRGFCREMTAAHPVKVGFSCDGVPRDLANHVSLAIYRVAQESLQNVVKHSRARSAQVALTREGDNLVLSISDDGTGFDPEISTAAQSLGLTSMKERIAMINGSLNIESGNGTGTRIYARVPVPTRNGN